MKIVIASDSFKESLSSKKVNSVIGNAIKKHFPDAIIKEVPIADGGEGTVEAITNSIPSEVFEIEVNGAIEGTKIKANWAKLNNVNSAVMETASIVGLNFIPPDRRNPLYTSTYGMGQMITSILDNNIKNIYIGLGGSSTNDGGAGALTALGVRFFDKESKKLLLGGYSLLNLDRIDISNLDSRIHSTRFTLLSDVENILCGNEGASYIFAPQKGADKEQIMILDKALERYQNVIKYDLGKDVSMLKGGGAAGGIGAGFHAFLDAEIKSGINTLLELIEFEKIISEADLVITGEGKIDNQTKYGKAISGITKYAQQQNKPVIAFCALLEGDKATIQKEVGLNNIFHVVDGETNKEMSMSNPELYLNKCITKNILNLF